VIFPIGATRRTQHHTAAETFYDAVVVGGGISGSIIADELSRAGKRVLVLEAGRTTRSRVTRGTWNGSMPPR
jgi:choline dehydrogenase-like flavoprotein